MIVRLIFLIIGTSLVLVNYPSKAASRSGFQFETDMNFPLFDPESICVIDQRPGGNPGPPPQRSDYPPGAGGDAMYRYAFAQWNYKLQRAIAENC
ncbi:MAG: hypothetical protein J0M19_01715 [Sphingomonadales bacterium]|nr:hypothetical protein [Sphingomonadales bacterium]